MTRWAVVLAGGIGSRFWPLSTQERPKQLLPLVTRRPMLVDQIERVTSGQVADASHTLVLTNSALVEAIHSYAPMVPLANIVAEPKPAGTAAALTWAAHLIQQRDGADATMISVHADWAISDTSRFQAALRTAATAAETHHSLVTVGIVPSRPDPGFGYIEPGEEVERGLRRVSRFVEKPPRDRAAEMSKAGYLWNSGIFAWRVGDFLDEVRRHAREVAPALDRYGTSAEAFFNAVQPIAIDHAVLERSARVLVVAGEFGWDDVGTWGALQRVRQRDGAGNAVASEGSGRVHATDARNNVVHTDGPNVVLYGVENLVVVAKDGLTLVTTTDKSADLKQLIDTLPPELREQS